MKDNFSTQSNDYAKFRPQYPQELIEHFLSLASGKEACWDCGTGNGQLAVQLAVHFKAVYATDISQRQLDNATQRENINYSLKAAEQTDFADHSFDLITVAQAAHWFDFSRFNPEVQRLLKPGGIVALFGYGLVLVEGKAGEIIKDFYWNVTKPFWDIERDHIEAKYTTIPFPFEELESPNLNIESDLSMEELLGYISTWSAVQHFIKRHGYSPIEQLRKDLTLAWEEESKRVIFPMFYRIGKKI